MNYFDKRESGTLFSIPLLLASVLLPLFGAQKLMLTIEKSSLNRDTNTTYTLKVKDRTGKTKNITESIEWIVTPSDAVKIEGDTITALKDTDVTIQAGYRGRLSNPVTLHIYWEVDGHRLPPEPDPKTNDATLLGIDSNNNGVRDDVERWIYEEYKEKHPIHIDIAMQAARGYRLVLEKQPKTKAEAMSIMKEVDSAADCEAYYKYNAKYLNESILIHDDVDSKYFRHKIYFNTQDRLDIYLTYDHLFSGDSYTLPSFEEEKKACDFNTSKYDKE